MPDSRLRAKPWIPLQRPSSMTLKNVSIVDVVAGRTLSDCSIELSNGSIVRVSTDAQNPIDSSPDTVAVDLKGKFVCPGLIDSHVHLYAAPGSTSLRELFAASPNLIAFRATFVAKQMLLRGFTSARDTGGGDVALKEAIEEGLMPGPRMWIAGKALTQTGGHGKFSPSFRLSHLLP